MWPCWERTLHSSVLSQLCARPSLEQPQRLGLWLFRLGLSLSGCGPGRGLLAAVPLPGRGSGFSRSKAGCMGSSSQTARARATTAGNSSASSNKSGSSKASMWGSAEGRCTPMVARPARMDRTTFSSYVDSESRLGWFVLCRQHRHHRVPQQCPCQRPVHRRFPGLPNRPPRLRRESSSPTSTGASTAAAPKRNSSTFTTSGQGPPFRFRQSWSLLRCLPDRPASPAGTRP